MSFELRRAKPEDIPELVKIENACFAQPWSETGFANELKKENAVLFAAFDDGGSIIGWAGMTYIFGEGSVTNVAVHPNSRRRKVGRALVLALLTKAVSLSLDRLLLEVRGSNAAAVSLYQNLGFITVGIRPGFYDFPREDAIIMSHSLDI